MFQNAQNFILPSLCATIKRCFKHSKLNLKKIHIFNKKKQSITHKSNAMRKILRSIPFLLVLLLIGLAISRWETINYTKLLGLSLVIIMILYFLFITLTEKYIDFRDGFKIKKIKIKKDEYASKKIGYILDFIYLIALALFTAWFYSKIILETPLNYLLNLSIGIAAVNLVLRKTLSIKTNKSE